LLEVELAHRSSLEHSFWIATAMLAVMAALALVSAPAYGSDKPADYHVSSDPAQRLFRLSLFAHGYIHGYESGFAMGDEDVQMARGEQPIEKSSEYHYADRGYERAFGDRESFRAGFREGLMVGYHDAISGGEFRALGELRRLATGLESELVSNASDAPYDGGFLAGYRAARQDHPEECKLEESKAAANAASVNSVRARFCSGFLDGYELGESDSGAIATARERSPQPSVTSAARSGPRR